MKKGIYIKRVGVILLFNMVLLRKPNRHFQVEQAIENENKRLLTQTTTKFIRNRLNMIELYNG